MSNKPTFDDIFGSDDELDMEQVGDLSDSDDADDDKPEAPAPSDEPEQVERVLPKFKKREPSASEEGTKKKRRKKRDEAEQTEASEPKTAENTVEDEVTRDLNDALDRIKSKRKKKMDGDDPEIDEIIVKLVEKMKEAAYSDQEFNRKQQPAIAKVTLLPAVIEHLSRPPDETINRARVPQPVRAAFDVVPKSELNWNKKGDKSKPSMADGQYKKLKSRIQLFKKRDKT
ncbi:hypothetical protein HDU67_010158 [Dinochytrium kinnereticum]|nr:hypothetical protein HDU67_010158 [Dinochytrium kinnereticum]